MLQYCSWNNRKIQSSTAGVKFHVTCNIKLRMRTHSPALRRYKKVHSSIYIHSQWRKVQVFCHKKNEELSVSLVQEKNGKIFRFNNFRLLAAKETQHLLEIQSPRMQRALDAKLACFFAQSQANKSLTHFLCFCHQEFKVFLLCFAVLVVATSAAKFCKCENREEVSSDSSEEVFHLIWAWVFHVIAIIRLQVRIISCVVVTFS